MEEGRLDLDDDGRVVGAHDGDHPTVDLGDLAGAGHAAASRLDAWVSTTLAAWVQRHRRGLAGATAALVVLVVATTAWELRPAPPAPPAPVLAADAVLDGADLGGPRIDGTGHLAVAYLVRSSSDTDYVVRALRGPGLDPLGVQLEPGPADRVTAAAPVRVAAEALVRCADPAIVTARPSDYALVVRAAGTDGPDVVVPFTGSTTHLDVAVRDHCLLHDVPAGLTVVEARLDGTPGSTVVGASFVVRNDSGVPVTVATERRDDGDVQVDLSQPAQLAPGSSALLQSRLLVDDCGAGPLLRPVLDDPVPVLGPGYGDPAAAPGVTLRIGLGDESALASYPWPLTLDVAHDRLRAFACVRPPAVSAQLVSAVGERTAGAAWAVDAQVHVRTSGIGITLGAERFTGPAWGSGSTLVTGGPVAPGSPWSAEPAQLDGGEGVLTLHFSGPSCAAAAGSAPESLSVHVLDAAQVSYPFQLPVDATRLQRAVDLACGTPR